MPGRSCEGCDLYPNSPPVLPPSPGGVGARSAGRLSGECHSWREAWFLLIPRLDVSSWLCCLAPGEGRAEGGAKHSSEPEYGRLGMAGRGCGQPPTPPQLLARSPLSPGAGFFTRAAGVGLLLVIVATPEMVLEDSAPRGFGVAGCWKGSEVVWGDGCAPQDWDPLPSPC